MAKYNKKKIIALRKKGLTVRAIKKKLNISSTSVVQFHLKNVKRIVALFECPMDNSTRSYLFDSFKEVKAYQEKYKKVLFLIIAFEYKGQILMPNQ